MKWYVPPTIIISGLNSMLAAAVLSLAAFHLFTDKSTNAPINPNEEWISHVILLTPFATLWMCISMCGMWIGMMKRSLWLSSMILVFDTISFVISIFLTSKFSSQLEIEDVSAESLFNTTLAEIIKANSVHQSKTWIPEWLDNVQKQSKHCCGIVTYRDYEKLWPNAPTKIPRSCCRNVKNNSSPCPDDLTRIPYPDTPSDYFKVDTGCMGEINQATRDHVRESYQNCIIMNLFIALGLFAFLLLYVKRYLAKAFDSDLDVNTTTKGNGGGGDAYTDLTPDIQNSAGVVQPANSTSSTYIPAIESMDVVQPVVSVDTLPTPMPIPEPPKPEPQKPEPPKPEPQKLETVRLIVAPPPPEPVKQEPKVQVEKERKHTHKPRLRAHSGTKINKLNAAFAGMQQLNPEAATGDETMTLGATSLGRQEVYVAQDTSADEYRNVAASNSFDDVGDIVVQDQDIGSPGGSPDRRRKKKSKERRRQRKD